MPQPKKAPATEPDVEETPVDVPAKDETPAAAASVGDVGSYVVIAVGAAYAVDGDPARIELGLQNRVVELVDSEAERLLLLGAIRAAVDTDIEREAARAEREKEAAAAEAAGPAGNPYGGSIVGGKTLEDHAREQIALAKGRKP